MKLRKNYLREKCVLKDNIKIDLEEIQVMHQFHVAQYSDL
jgi:hypothetical protein